MSDFREELHQMAEQQKWNSEEKLRQKNEQERALPHKIAKLWTEAAKEMLKSTVRYQGFDETGRAVGFSDLGRIYLDYHQFAKGYNNKFDVSIEKYGYADEDRPYICEGSNWAEPQKHISLFMADIRARKKVFYEVGGCSIECFLTSEGANIFNEVSELLAKDEVEASFYLRCSLLRKESEIETKLLPFSVKEMERVKTALNVGYFTDDITINILVKAEIHS